MTGRWYFSGEQISEISESSIFSSRQVVEFLSDSRKLLLLSAKGMGKTHLLRHKRANLTRRNPEIGHLVIPVSMGSDVDRQGSFPPNLGKPHWASISHKEWALLWEISISISILLHYRSGRDERYREVRIKLMELASLREMPEELSNEIYEWGEGKTEELPTPLEVINGLIKSPISFRKKLLREAQNQIVRLYKHHITSAIYVFIDSVDQALIETDDVTTDTWVDGQTGLAVAIYYLNVNCPHIKVYSAIRQEAWNRFDHENKEVIESHCTRLEYSRSEMRGMLDFLANWYEGAKTFGDIFKTPEPGMIRNFGVKSCGEYVAEEMFDYIYRHSLGSPRSLLHIANGICTQVERNQAPEKLEKEIRREVNLKAGGIAETKIKSEMARFLKFFSDANLSARFFALLRGNVMRRSELREISGYLSENSREAHPFCELYNLGLIGVIKKDTDGELIQKFKSPMDFEWRFESHIPDSDFYFLHPALEARLSEKYVINVEDNVVVSDGEVWKDKWSQEIEDKTFRVFISYSTSDADFMRRVTSAMSRVFLREKVRFEVWLDSKMIAPANKIDVEIGRGIDWANAMICLVTKDYLASRWCQAEFSAMHTAGMKDETKKLFPFVVDGVNRDALGALHSGVLVPGMDSGDDASILDGVQKVARWRRDNERK